MVIEHSSPCDLHQGKGIVRSSPRLLWPPPSAAGGQDCWRDGSRRQGWGSGSPCRGAAYLHIGGVEIPERGEGSRQPLSAVPDPQGLEMARRDSYLLTEALEAIRDKSASRAAFPPTAGCAPRGCRQEVMHGKCCVAYKEYPICEPSLPKTKD